MRKRRLTIARILGLILFVGFFLAGLRSGSNDWFKSIYSLTFILLVYAAIAAKFREAFWYGFALAGWAYFVVGFGPWIGSPPGTQPLRAVNRNLVTSVILEVVTDKLSDPDTLGGGRRGSFVLTFVDAKRTNRDGIAHCALTVLFGFVGGLVSRALARRPTPEDREPTAPS